MNAYNEKHPNIQIEMMNYADSYPDPSDAMNQIKIEIAAGKGPDMIDFKSSFYSPVDASSGILTDLYTFMENDPTFDKEDYYFNILDSFAVGNNLYVLVPGVYINSFATNNRAFKGLEYMTINQLINAYKGLDNDSILFPGETKRDVLAMLCYGGLENYIDWGQGVCYFDEDSFKEILQFANQFPLKLSITNDYSAKAYFSEGRALLYPVCISSVFDLAKTRMLYGEVPVYIGYPIESESGNMAEIADVAIGINVNCRNKEEAWEFLKSLLGSEFQDDMKKGLPIRIDSLGKKMADAMSTDLDANGNMVVKDRMVWEGEEAINIYEISAEDAGTLEDILYKIKYNAAIDRVIYSIILEEAEALFQSEKRVDDVAALIQNRANLYMKENR